MPRFGVGFRTQHFAELAARPPGVDWLELLSDNHLGVGGPRRAQLEKLRAEYPLALHGVGLGIANDQAPRGTYVAALRELADFVQPLFVSDHLCWTGLGGVTCHDLLPVATTRELLGLVCERVARVQEALGRRILLENASAYVKLRADESSEAELLAALCERTGCGVLLDVNNLFVNAQNLGVDPYAALAALAPRHVGYLHVAGHATLGDVRVDTHGSPVPPEVWTLFEHAARRFPDAAVMLERDDAIPGLGELVAELELAREHWRRAQAARGPDVAVAAHAVAASDARCSNSPPWREMQRTLWHCITQRAPEGCDEALASSIDARVPVSPSRGLRIYQDAYAAMPERALAANFPTLARVLSRRDFRALCAAFARRHPSTSHDYLPFGAPLAAFVLRFAFADRYDVDTAAFADIARLEQAQLEAQEAPDDEATLAPDALGALQPGDWEGARFAFSRGMRIVPARWDVLPAVRAVAAGERPALPERVESAYLVARVHGAVRTEPVDPVGARALGALLGGASFPEACDAAGGEGTAPAAATAIARAAAIGAVCAVRRGNRKESPRGGRGSEQRLSLARFPASSSGFSGCSR